MNIRLQLPHLAFIGFTVLILSIPYAADAKIINKNIITNGGFENVETLTDDWDCYIKYSAYSSSCIILSGYDDEQKTGEYYFRVGSALSNGGYVYNHIAQGTIIPKRAEKSTLRFDYQWHTLDPKSSRGDDMFYVQLNIAIPYSDTIVKREIIQLHTNSESFEEWTSFSYDLSEYAGYYVYPMFVVVNNSDLVSSAYIDNVQLRVKSRSTLKGTVKDTNGNIITGAKVRVFGPKGKRVFKGKTGKKGKFKATELKGKKKKYTVKIIHDDKTYTFKRRVKWGKLRKTTFTLDDSL